jgi:hypothetical protein
VQVRAQARRRLRVPGVRRDERPVEEPLAEMTIEVTAHNPARGLHGLAQSSLTLPSRVLSLCCAVTK